MQKSPLNAAKQGFTLVEVMAAAFVLGTAILGCMAALTQAFQLLDDARNKTLACQIIQSDIETTRLFNFDSISTQRPSGGIDLAQDIKDLKQGFAAHRTVTDVIGSGNSATMKQITVEVSWHDYRGRQHSFHYTTYFGKGGLSDYFVTNRPAI